jgi:hypothetical protein
MDGMEGMAGMDHAAHNHSAHAAHDVGAGGGGSMDHDKMMGPGFERHADGSYFYTHGAYRLPACLGVFLPA